MDTMYFDHIHSSFPLQHPKDLPNTSSTQFHALLERKKKTSLSPINAVHVWTGVGSANGQG